MSARSEYLAKAMQRRDAAQYGPVIEHVQHPTWDEIGEPGRDEYLADAQYAVDVLAAFDRIEADLDDELAGKALARAAEYDPSDCD